MGSIMVTSVADLFLVLLHSRAFVGRADGGMSVRILFFGNHTVGVRALSALSETESICAVVAHPADPEDGVRYESVYEFAGRHGWQVIRSHGKDPALPRFVRSARPDLIWITDYRYLLPRELLDLSPHGAVNLHPSLLPKYRGRAPINWAIINGETRLGLTAHVVDEGMDTGDIIAQFAFDLAPPRDVGDALELLYPLYGEISRTVARHFRTGNVPRIRQDHSQATVFPRRKPEDGLIDWHMSVRSVWNLIRAVAHPYPGAFTTMHGQRLTVWKGAPSPHASGRGVVAGAIVDIADGAVHVQCGDGVLMLLRIQPAKGISIAPMRAGDVLGT